jgi:hypothetical protein
MHDFGYQLRAEVGEGAQRLVESRAENQTVRDLNAQVFLCSYLSRHCRLAYHVCFFAAGPR